MSYEDGWAALNLEMPARIPRTEYSAEGHWDLIKAVTGIDVGVESPDDVKLTGQRRISARLELRFLLEHADLQRRSRAMCAPTWAMPSTRPAAWIGATRSIN